MKQVLYFASFFFGCKLADNVPSSVMSVPNTCESRSQGLVVDPINDQIIFLE